MLIHFLHPPHRHYLDIEFCRTKPLLIVFADKDPLESQFLGLGYALLYPVHGADLTAKSHFPGKT